MKILTAIIVFGCAAVSAAWAGVDLSKPVPVMRLSDGRIMKNVEFTKFGVVVVSTKSNLGHVGLRYEALPDEVRAAAEQKRPGGPKWFAGDTSGNTRTISGQVFVQTRGAGAYKFGNVDVYAFDISALSYFDGSARLVRLPKPIYRTTTDADGNFSVKVPLDRTCFIFVEASRLRTAGLDSWTERHQWRIAESAARAGKPLMLTQDNAKTPRAVEIESVE